MESAVICAESIALLHLLQPIPTQPSENRAELSSHSHQSYRLPFDTERSLASALAFLAATKDGPEHIPAICLQEVPCSRSLNVLVAVNKAKWADGDLVLNELEVGFRGIFLLLSTIANDSLPLALDGVFAAIIKMCNRRIQCRLRFTPNHRKKTKPPIRKVLQDSVQAIKQLLPPSSEAKRYLEQARYVMKKLSAWSTHQTPERLKELVTDFYELSRVFGLSDLLRRIPDKNMAPDARRSLLNIINKVGRYRGVAVFLCNTAVRYSILRRARIVPVRLPESFYRKTSAYPGTSDLESMASRFGDRYGGRFDMAHIYPIIGLTKKQANSQFVDQTTKSLRNSRIHAEIQLIFYCELEHLLPPPRVICSSKDACFLCNSFILMHEKFHVPRCHGKIYPGWRLPETDLGRKRQHFNDRLQQQIEDSLALLIARRVKTSYLDPNESTLLTLPRSRSTLESNNMSEQVKDAVTLSVSDSALSPSSSAHSCQILMNGTDSIATNGYVEHEKPCNDVFLKSAVSSPTPETRPSPYLPISGHSIFSLSPGKEVSVSIEHNITAAFEAPGCLEVYIEHSSDSQADPMSRDQPIVDCCVKWLTEQGRASERSKARIIDTEHLQDEITLQRSEVQNLWLLAKGDILQIRAARNRHLSRIVD